MKLKSLSEIGHGGIVFLSNLMVTVLEFTD